MIGSQRDMEKDLDWGSPIPFLPALTVKPEPPNFALAPSCRYAMTNYVSGSDQFDGYPADADLMDIKIEELCYMTGENGQGFVFVEPKGCDDAGYDTSNSFSSDNSSNDQSLDHNWIDSPSSVESFLSSCSEFCDYNSNNTETPPQLYINPPSITAEPHELLSNTPTRPDTFQLAPDSPPPATSIQCKPMMPTLLLYPAADQNQRYVHKRMSLRGCCLASCVDLYRQSTNSFTTICLNCL